MTVLEEVHELVHHHLVILFLLLDKHIKMFSRQGIEKADGFFLFSNHKFIISLEVITQLEENLEG